jgi:hypothetical protein
MLDTVGWNLLKKDSIFKALARTMFSTQSPLCSNQGPTGISFHPGNPSISKEKLLEKS